MLIALVTLHFLPLALNLAHMGSESSLWPILASDISFKTLIALAEIDLKRSS